MKTSLVLTGLLLLFSTVSFSQNKMTRPKLNSSSKISSALKSEAFTLVSAGETNMHSADLKWLPILSSRCDAKVHNSPNDELLKKFKAEKTRFKLENYTKPENDALQAKTTGGPAVGTNFLGNTNSGNSPLDNSIAISDGGWIVSVANTTIEFDDINGNNTYYSSIPAFFNFNSITVTCDPVVLYDSGEDRFIIFAQECSGNSSNSNLLIAFSKTNNPNDGFWTYKITGNPLNNSKWFDYPKLAVSTNELYITGNLFSNNPNAVFSEAILYQIEKANAYNGGSINWQYWTGIDGTPFTLLPVSFGQSGNYGPGCFLVSTRTGTLNTKINVYDLTDDMSASNEQLDYYEIATDPYGPAGDASQLGTSVLLDNGSCRALSGFYLNGIIHFVFHSDVGGGYNGINYNRLNVSTQTNQSSTYGAQGTYDFSYPSVASFASSPTDASVIINFGASGTSVYPHVMAVHVDNALNWSSSTIVKSSDTYVAHTSTVTERWGDYTGACRKHNASVPTVWLSGMFATTNNVWDTWVAEIYSSPTGLNEQTSAASQVKVFPNPIVETFSLEFVLDEQEEIGISIKDINGKVVKDLYKGQANFGKNTFSFNKANLSTGIYFLVISTPSKILKNEKISIQN